MKIQLYLKKAAISCQSLILNSAVKTDALALYYSAATIVITGGTIAKRISPLCRLDCHSKRHNDFMGIIYMSERIIGREEEPIILEELFNSKEAEFLSIYGHNE